MNNDNSDSMLYDAKLHNNLLRHRGPNPIFKVDYSEEGQKILSNHYEVAFLYDTNYPKVVVGELNPTSEPLRPIEFSSQYQKINYNENSRELSITGHYKPTGRKYKLIVYMEEMQE